MQILKNSGRMISMLLSALAAVLFATTVSAQGAVYTEGVHYQQLDTPVRTADTERVEVVELFWYGCPGCYTFEPYMQAWETAQDASVDHKRLPASWNPLMKIHAQAYYTAQALDVLDAVHDPFFNEYHRNRNRLQNEVAIREFFESCGISREDFDRTFNSFTVRTRVNQAARLMAQYGTAAQTPSIYVNGKYVVTTAVGSYQEMLNVVDFLVELESG